MKRNLIDASQLELEDKVVSIKRVTKVVKGGRNFRFTALVSASTLQKDVKAELENTDDVQAAAKVGTVIGKKAVEAGIESVVFDRGGYIYHGKVKALADAAREAGLEF